MNDKENQIRKPIMSNYKMSCNAHGDIDDTPKTYRMIFYSIIGVIGFVILIYGLYTIFAGFFWHKIKILKFKK